MFLFLEIILRDKLFTYKKLAAFKPALSSKPVEILLTVSIKQVKMMYTNAVTFSIVVPMYCEEAHVNEVVTSIRKKMDPLDASWELILVDDGSIDATWSAIEEQARQISTLRAVRLSRNFGKEAAICAGLDMARGDATILLDADLQHPHSLIIEMVKIWRESDVNIVEAVKTKRGDENFVSKCSSRLFYALFNRLSGFNLTGASDFKLIDRQVRNAWLKMGERNLFYRGMIAWLGFKRVQLPFDVQKRTCGKSRWSFFALLKLALTGLTTFSAIPLQLTSILGIVFFFFALIIGTHSLYMKLAGKAITGFTTVIILQLFIGGLVLFALGIIGEYIARIYEETKRRPRYVVMSQIMSKEKENKENVE